MRQLSGGAAALALGLGATLAPLGCGGVRRQRAPTGAQFVTAADAICDRERAKLAYIEMRTHVLRRSPSSKAVLRQQAAASQLATARLEALARPPAQGARIQQWLTARTVAATIALDLAEAPARGDARAVEDVRAQLARARAQATARQLALGSRVCGESPW